MTIAEMKLRTDVPVVVVNRHGRFIYVNQMFTQTFGWTLEEAVGNELAIIIPVNLRDAHNMGFSRFLSTEKATLMHQNLNLKAVNKKGEIFDAQHFIIAEKINGEWQFASTIVPLNV